MKKVFLVLCGVFFLGVVGPSVLRAEDAVHIKVAGADSMHSRIHGLSNSYMNTVHNVLVEVSAGGLVEDGIAMLMEHKADVAMASRKLTDGEAKNAAAKGIEMREEMIGYGGIVLIVNKANPLEELSLEQAAHLLRGDWDKWSRVGGADRPVKIFAPGERHPGTRHYIETELLGHAPLSSGATVVQNFPTVMQGVADNPDGFGFVRIRDAFESRNSLLAGVKPLKIKKDDASPAVMPSRASVQDGSYAVKRPYYLYTLKDARAQVLDFVAFIKSKGWGVNEL